MKTLTYKGDITFDITNAAQELRSGQSLRVVGFRSRLELNDFAQKFPKMWYHQEGVEYKERINSLRRFYIVENTGLPRKVFPCIVALTGARRE